MTIETSKLPVGRQPDERASHASDPMIPIYCMAIGTFAIGTEGYMIAPLLPRMAEDFGIPISTTALLITVFTLTLALSSPVLTILSARQSRRNVLLAALSVFAVANVVAWASTDFHGILIARIILAIAAGLYVPSASALAGSIVAPERRGTALSIVNGGTSIAVALGLPLGSLVGNAFGWRMTFLAVGIMAVIATIGIALGVSSSTGAHLPVPGFQERLAVATQRNVVLTLLVTLLWSAGVYVAYPMIAPYLMSVAKLSGWGITAMVSLWGASAVFGVLVSGRLTDRFGSTRVVAASLLLAAIAFIVLAWIALASFAHPILPLVFAVAFWGASAWSAVPALMTRLVQVGGAPAAPISLSLNYSVMYAGFGIGSAIGASILANGTIVGIQMAAAVIEAIAFVVFLATRNLVASHR